jgi:hypothetical protein
MRWLDRSLMRWLVAIRKFFDGSLIGSHGSLVADVQLTWQLTWQQLRCRHCPPKAMASGSVYVSLSLRGTPHHLWPLTLSHPATSMGNYIGRRQVRCAI